MSKNVFVCKNVFYVFFNFCLCHHSLIFCNRRLTGMLYVSRPPPKCTPVARPPSVGPSPSRPSLSTCVVLQWRCPITHPTSVQPSQAGPTWVVYMQQTRRVGGAPSSQVPTVVCLWSLSQQTGWDSHGVPGTSWDSAHWSALLVSGLLCRCAYCQVPGLYLQHM